MPNADMDSKTVLALKISSGDSSQTMTDAVFLKFDDLKNISKYGITFSSAANSLLSKIIEQCAQKSILPVFRIIFSDASATVSPSPDKIRHDELLLPASPFIGFIICIVIFTLLFSPFSSPTPLINVTVSMFLG